MQSFKKRRTNRFLGFNQDNNATMNIVKDLAQKRGLLKLWEELGSNT